MCKSKKSLKRTFNSLMRRQVSPHKCLYVVLAKPHPSALSSSLSTQLPYVLSFFLFLDQFPCYTALFRLCFNCHLAPFLSFFHTFLLPEFLLIFTFEFIAQDSEKLSSGVFLVVSWISTLFLKLFFPFQFLSCSFSLFFSPFFSVIL